MRRVTSRARYRYNYSQSAPFWRLRNRRQPFIVNAGRMSRFGITDVLCTVTSEGSYFIRRK
jgi:hypothetical protein